MNRDEISCIAEEEQRNDLRMKGNQLIRAAAIRKSIALQWKDPNRYEMERR